MPDPIHHIHKRKCHSESDDTNYIKKITDKLVYVVAFLGPIMTLPQSHDIWSHKDAGSVSLLTWGTYVIANIIWLFYGFLHKEKPIIYMYSLGLIVNLTVVVGVIIYG